MKKVYKGYDIILIAVFAMLLGYAMAEGGFMVSFIAVLGLTIYVFKGLSAWWCDDANS